MEILTLFASFSTLTSTTSIGQLAIIAQAILTMTGASDDVGEFPLG